jgi:hypothetical protein
MKMDLFKDGVDSGLPMDRSMKENLKMDNFME